MLEPHDFLRSAHQVSSLTFRWNPVKISYFHAQYRYLDTVPMTIPWWRLETNEFLEAIAIGTAGWGEFEAVRPLLNGRANRVACSAVRLDQSVKTYLALAFSLFHVTHIALCCSCFERKLFLGLSFQGCPFQSVPWLGFELHFYLAEGDSSLKRFQRLQVLRVSSTPLAPPDASIRKKALILVFLWNFWMLRFCADGGNIFYRSLKGEVPIGDFTAMLYPTFLHWLFHHVPSSKLMPCIQHQFASGLQLEYVAFDLSSPPNLLWTPRQNHLRRYTSQ